MPTKANIEDSASELRARAERRSNHNARSAMPNSDADARRLLHELEVHQIELEMQNSELRVARDDLESLLEKYTDLYDFAPVGYLTLGADCTIRLANLTGSMLVGTERSKLLGRNFCMLVSPEHRAAFRTFFNQIFSAEGKQTGDFELAGGKHPPRAINIEALRSPDGAECSVVIVDITARKQAEVVLRRNEALFSALVEQAPVGVYVVDAGFRLHQANPMAMLVFQNIHPLIGRDFPEIVNAVWPRRVADQIIGHFRHTLETGEAYESPRFVERRRDTRVKETYEWQIQRVILPAGEYGVVCFFSNITERVRAEAAQRRMDALTSTNLMLKQEIGRRQLVEADLRASRQQQSQLLKQSRLQQRQLRELSRGILVVQEEERKRISRELHDVVTQTLVGINVHLAALAQGATEHPASLQQQISRTHLLVEKAVDIVHNFAGELRPTMLDDLGLIPALQTHMQRFMEDTGIRASLKAYAKIEESSSAVRTLLYRVAQEALANVARHAEATHVEVTIESLAGAISMKIEDDGKGFVVGRKARSKKNAGLGLLGMRERVEMVGGKFHVESAVGGPTTIHVEIPAAKSRVSLHSGETV